MVPAGKRDDHDTGIGVCLALPSVLRDHRPIDLLHRMGYGASRADLQRVGGVGEVASTA